jgi:hypothetical protein
MPPAHAKMSHETRAGKKINTEEVLTLPVSLTGLIVDRLTLRGALAIAGMAVHSSTGA